MERASSVVVWAALGLGWLIVGAFMAEWATGTDALFGAGAVWGGIATAVLTYGFTSRRP